MAEVVGLSVALVLAVAQFVVELQVGTLPEGFAVGGAQYVAALIRGSGVISGSIVGGVLSSLILHEEQAYFVVGRVLTIAASAAGLKPYDNVPSLRIQPAIELQHSPGILVVAVGETGALVVINEDI